jgi:phosphoglycolate phosphatase-like HAD superfamily hydrolase
VKEYSALFWDFDGVVKDSVAAKSSAYERLFESYGPDLGARIRRHHELNGGVSRFDKIPLYLEWAGIAPTADEVGRHCEMFAADVTRSVVESPWVPGAREYLERYCERQLFFLVTGTPQKEMEDILTTLKIGHCFREIHGSPVDKGQAVGSVLRRWGIDAAKSLLIGDSESDLSAAESNGVRFMLRRTAQNTALQRSFIGLQVENFING